MRKLFLSAIFIYMPYFGARNWQNIVSREEKQDIYGNVFFYRVPRLALTLVPTSRYRYRLKKDGWTPFTSSISLLSLMINYVISLEICYRQPVLLLSFSLSLSSIYEYSVSNSVFLSFSLLCDSISRFSFSRILNYNDARHVAAFAMIID